MIQVIGNYYALQTINTTYAFRVMETGHLEHLYYGGKLTLRNEEDFGALCEQWAMAPGNTIAYDDDNNLSLENIRLEFSSRGKGDFREPAIGLEYKDGSFTSDFVFERAGVITEKPEYETLPSSYDDGSFAEMPTQVLKIELKDKNSDVRIELYYSVFYETDVITKMTLIKNDSDNDVIIDRIMSNQLDFGDSGYVFTSFNGAWTREFGRNDNLLKSGKIVNSSNTGVSSNRANPFVMISKPGADEDTGSCYGFNLIYSGNHYECMEISPFNKTRFVQGINPEGFRFRLKAHDTFEAPEAVMTFSDEGFNGMSRNMHTFVREHIVRGNFKHKNRPVLLNSWEACYFDISEHKLLNLAKKAKDVGIELFVMDDGWFGKRNDDTSSLGDWSVNTSKLPNGLSGLSKKIKALGLEFGLWVEPEMVNEDSNLYKRHPDWVLRNPATAHSKGRNQMILDLGKEQVRNYITDTMSEVFGSCDVSYVKWDMNRNFSDVFSQGDIPSGEVYHRYVTGLYSVMKNLTEKFPEILFEGCSSGGNRFDLGMLCYFPQIWASDNTDAMCRTKIQNGLSYGYPQSVMGSHVSASPNHQTLRRSFLDTRFNVASVGLLGYELNLCDLPSEELKKIRDEIKLYKSIRDTVQWGTFFRGRSFDNGNICEWTIVSKDREDAVTVLIQKEAVPNMPTRKVYIKGLEPSERYTIVNTDASYSLKDFGDLVNMILPVHIKQDSWAYNTLDKIKKLDGEKENITGYGDAFAKAGIFLKQGFAGVGYNENTAYFQDGSSRMYLIKKN
ncbi:MAG: alpha-galactosidase [Lachnospiraceae bacterium]|nr:alpha-galactosidase [Lachnospiraceae bacterium]